MPCIRRGYGLGPQLKGGGCVVCNLGQGGGGGAAGGGEGDDEDAMPLLAPERALAGDVDHNEVFEKDPIKLFRYDPVSDWDAVGMASARGSGLKMLGTRRKVVWSGSKGGWSSF